MVIKKDIDEVNSVKSKFKTKEYVLSKGKMITLEGS